MQDSATRGPSYLLLHSTGRLNERVEAALELISPACRLCPRNCAIDRLAGEAGICRIKDRAIVASYFPHFGEEAPLVGTHGSGTIFFSSCNLLCSFCQNSDISHRVVGDIVDPEGLAAIMVRLKKMGCHNINFVTPTHVAPFILQALIPAIELGLDIPLVYNCGGYERTETLRLLEGIFDIYMPDIKFLDSDLSKQFCNAPDYPSVAMETLKEMQRQVGDLQTDHEGIARRGLIIRHLVMPSYGDNTREALRFIRERISEDAFVNIMAQYHPCHRASENPAIARRITTEEYRAALKFAQDIGLKRAGAH